MTRTIADAALLATAASLAMGTINYLAAKFYRREHQSAIYIAGYVAMVFSIFILLIFIYYLLVDRIITLPAAAVLSMSCLTAVLSAIFADREYRKSREEKDGASQ